MLPPLGMILMIYGTDTRTNGGHNAVWAKKGPAKEA
jgi:hypothetical protein